MATFVGHGPFLKYSCEATISETKPLSELLEKLSIPLDLVDNLILVKGNNIIESSDLVKNDDTIHLYLAVFGG